jgi:ABC-2 type transport system ATP-binding protein
MMTPAIEICGLEKTYAVGFWRKRPRRALLPLSLAVNQGETFGYLGPNGAGKTTTLKLLMGLIYPTAGTARILGRELGDAQMKAQIGYLPEHPYFYDYLTGSELLEYYAQLSGMEARGRAQKIAAMLERVGLREAARVQLRKYSKGMLQRVGIAQAILHDPQVVFLDEPMSGLDPMGRREVRDLIQGLRDEGKTVFFSTHILSDAEALCSRVAVLNRGELKAIGTVSELTAGAGGQVEIMWQGTQAMAAIAGLAGECRVNGELARATIAEAMLDRAIDALRRANCRLISVTPVRMTLEDYFMQQLGRGEAAEAGATERSALAEAAR